MDLVRELRRPVRTAVRRCRAAWSLVCSVAAFACSVALVGLHGASNASVSPAPKQQQQQQLKRQQQPKVLVKASASHLPRRSWLSTCTTPPHRDCKVSTSPWPVQVSAALLRGGSLRHECLPVANRFKTGVASCRMVEPSASQASHCSLSPQWQLPH